MEFVRKYREYDKEIERDPVYVMAVYKQERREIKRNHKITRKARNHLLKILENLLEKASQKRGTVFGG